MVKKKKTKKARPDKVVSMEGRELKRKTKKAAGVAPPIEDEDELDVDEDIEEYSEESEEEVDEALRPEETVIDTKGFEDLAVPVDDLPEFLRMGIFAKSGVGKTRFCGTASDCLLIDMGEKGHLSLRGSGTRVFKARSWSDFEKAYWYLHKTLAEGTCPFKNLALDTFTGLIELGKMYILDLEGMEDVDKDSVDFEGSKWNKLTILMKYWVDALTDLPINQIWTAHEKLKSDDDSGYEIFPELPPGIRSAYARGVDILARLYLKTKKRDGKKVTTLYLTAAPSEEVLTKDRIFALKGKTMKKPTFPKVYEAVYGKGE